jgi:muramidase (phage lysozyme)
MTAGTFHDAQDAPGLDDFSPHSQDLAAAWLLHRDAILPYLKIGDFNGALGPASGRWSSLPMNENDDANPKNHGQVPKDYTTVF